MGVIHIRHGVIFRSLLFTYIISYIAHISKGYCLEHKGLDTALKVYEICRDEIAVMFILLTCMQKPLG